MSKERQARTVEPDGMLPLVEVFGSAFAALILVFLFLNLFSGSLRSRMLPPEPEEGDYRVAWPGGTNGWVILAYADRLRIVERQTDVFSGHICAEDGAYLAYARTHYLNTGDKFIFAIFEGGVKSFLEARSCLVEKFPGQTIRIGFIIADREFLKAISDNEIPAYIDRVLTRRPVTITEEGGG